jgi:hypothetical protein
MQLKRIKASRAIAPSMKRLTAVSVVLTAPPLERS